MKLTRILLIYFVVLALVSILNRVRPDATAQIINLIFHPTYNPVEHPFIRYRLIIWLAGSAVFICLQPFVFFKGLQGMTSERMKVIPWWHFAVLALAIPLAVIGVPMVAMCNTCWTKYDFVAAFLNVSVFVVAHIIVQAIYIKIVGGFNPHSKRRR